MSERRIVQINFSRTATVGTIRGMHYQNSPHAEMKLIRCLRGKVWDVALDLRADSNTFMKYHAEELTSENTKMMVIAEGCAHGFQVLTEDSELLYLHTNHYTPGAEGAVRYNDPAFGIEWPLGVTDISERDKMQHIVPNDFPGILL